MSDYNNNLGQNLKPKNKFLIYSIVGVLTILIVGGVFSFFVPVFGQTIMARAMDGIGQHKLAMQLDAIHQNPALAAISSVDPGNPDSCASLFQYADNFEANRIEAMQMKYYLTVKPINNTYAQDFYFNTYMDARVNLQTQQAYANMEMKIKADGDKLVKMANEVESGSLDSSLQGNYQISTNVDSYVDADGASFKINQFDVEMSKVNTKDSLENWYGQKFDLSRTQKQGVEEMMDLFMDVSEWKMQDMLSEKSGKSIMSSYCKSIDKIEVQSPTQITIGRDNLATKVRPVIVTPKGDIQKIQAETTPDMIETLINDDKLADFFKSKYAEFTRLDNAIAKVDNSYKKSSLSETEYQKNIQEMFDQARRDFDKEKYREELGQSSISDSSGMEITNKPIEYYIDIDTGYLAGVKTEITIKPTDSTLRDIPNGELKDILAEGFSITQEIYDIRYNKDAENITRPDSIKTIDDFAEDAAKTQFYKEVVEPIINAQAENNSSSNQVYKDDYKYNDNYGKSDKNENMTDEELQRILDGDVEDYVLNLN